MKCPICDGDLKTIDNVINEMEDEIYRAKKCSRCKNIIYTVEYQVILNQRFAEDWAANHRNHEKPKTKKKEKEKKNG